MSEAGPSAVRSVAIVGRGRTPWLAAIALHRAFARQGLEVTVVEQPGQAAPQAFHAALPDLVNFHRPLGIAEGDLLRGAGATYAVGQQFAGWSGGDRAFLHGYGETGEPIGDLPFVQFWAKARHGGLRAAFADFSLSASAARHGRLAPP
ncbi:tryptophan 7-halogenase, partial [Sphingomonas bacterium]|uniref:tryptophan 7-halogenase n=1 Tax=Sphingomonas bacterium TaxID=1895847 RepID=UPI001576736B